MAAVAHDRSNREHEGRPRTDEQAVSTYLVVPYFPSDRGRPGIERPLGSNVVSWLCPSIIVNGQPGKNAFTRGERTTVTVDVANWGAGTAAALAHVRVWWADPSTAFTTKTFFGQAVVAVPTGGLVRRCPPITAVIPTSAPTHVCLLAHVSSPLDPTPPNAPADPVNDRHWAQLNIAEIATTANTQFQFMLWTGNPFARTETFEVTVAPVSAEALRTLPAIRRAETVRVANVRAGLVGGSREVVEAREPEPVRRLTLQPGERRAVRVIGRLPDEVEPGTAVALEVTQRVYGDADGDAGSLTGSVGLIATRRA